MSYLCGQDFKPYILSGHSPPLLAILQQHKTTETMPKYLPNSRFSDCWSSVGNITFYHRDGICYYKSKPVCKFSGTPDQMKAVEVHRRALEAWRTLPHETQLRWNGYAGQVLPHRPPFNGTGHTSRGIICSSAHITDLRKSETSTYPNCSRGRIFLSSFQNCFPAKI